MNISLVKLNPYYQFQNTKTAPKSHTQWQQNYSSFNAPKYDLPGYNASICFHPSFSSKKTDSINALKKQSLSELYNFNEDEKKSVFPKSYTGIFSTQKANIIGAGSIITNYLNAGNILKTLYQNNQIRANIYDPKFSNDSNTMKNFEEYNILTNSDDINTGAAYIFSPSKFHTHQMSVLSQRSGLTGIFTDKPICIRREELQELEALTQTSKIPLYFGDYSFFSQIPALRLMGVDMPYKNAITIQFDNSKDKKFTKCIENAKPFYKTTDIKHITGKINEKESEEFKTRTWLLDKTQGGGVLFDLQVHISNLLNLMGLELTNIDALYAAKHTPDGFKLITETETEDRIIVEGRINKTIPIHFEASQFMNTRENYILITGKDGNKIKITTDLFDKKVELLDRNNNILSRAYSAPMPYALMLHHAGSFFNDKETNKTPMFFDIQKKTMNQIFAIKALIEKQA